MGGNGRTAENAEKPLTESVFQSADSVRGFSVRDKVMDYGVGVQTNYRNIFLVYKILFFCETLLTLTP